VASSPFRWSVHFHRFDLSLSDDDHNDNASNKERVPARRSSKRDCQQLAAPWKAASSAELGATPGRSDCSCGSVALALGLAAARQTSRRCCSVVLPPVCLHDIRPVCALSSAGRRGGESRWTEGRGKAFDI